MPIVAAGITAQNKFRRSDHRPDQSHAPTERGAASQAASPSESPKTRFNGDGHLGIDLSPSTRRTPELDRDAAGDAHEFTEEQFAAEHCEKAAFFHQVLMRSGIAELKRVAVHVGDGHVLLSGRVSTFYTKQLAQECLRPYAIGLRIDNRLHVDLPQ